jgi:predicted transposase/invertase (TIGR01784 family)
LNKNNGVIQKVHEKAALVTRDKESMRIYEMREKALSDWTSGVNHAIREDRKEIARNFKAMGISIEQIAQGTGLTEQQIKDL